VRTLPRGEQVFFSLYFVMTGAHAAHVLIGGAVLGGVLRRMGQGRITAARPAFLENAALYWHLVDIVWIYLFPLFYLVHR
jgi:cytochrome c oxidase subunit 3